MEKNKKVKNWKCFSMIIFNITIGMLIMIMIIYDRVHATSSDHDVTIALIAILGSICAGFTLYYTGHNYFKFKYGSLKNEIPQQKNPEKKQDENKIE